MCSLVSQLLRYRPHPPLQGSNDSNHQVVCCLKSQDCGCCRRRWQRKCYRIVAASERVLPRLQLRINIRSFEPLFHSALTFSSTRLALAVNIPCTWACGCVHTCANAFTEAGMSALIQSMRHKCTQLLLVITATVQNTRVCIPVGRRLLMMPW